MGECPACGLPFTVTAVARPPQPGDGWSIFVDAQVTMLCECADQGEDRNRSF
jgi:hypothetical protein